MFELQDQAVREEFLLESGSAKAPDLQALIDVFIIQIEHFEQKILQTISSEFIRHDDAHAFENNAAISAQII